MMELTIVAVALFSWAIQGIAMVAAVVVGVKLAERLPRRSA